MDLDSFLSPITAKELAGVYMIDARKVRSALANLDDELTTVTFSNVLDRTQDGSKVIYEVYLALASGEPVLNHDIQRWLCDKKQLRERPSEKGKVVFRVFFYCILKFQGAGLATYLLPREEQAFKKWGAREIQVLAMDKGRWIWTRPKFGYKLGEDDFRATVQRYIDWQRQRGLERPQIPKLLEDFPRDFLETQVNSLALFKVL
ncbi:MAG TPA: hypothetical protein VMJ93_12105 [Verrucomicrobiae bacterium]|nr:hypothetical protein [Verrucomicrobiae bacterium]